METDELTNDQIEILKIIYDVVEDGASLSLYDSDDIEYSLLKINKKNKFEIAGYVFGLLLDLDDKKYIGSTIDENRGSVYYLREKGYNKLKEVS